MTRRGASRLCPFPAPEKIPDPPPVGLDRVARDENAAYDHLQDHAPGTGIEIGLRRKRDDRKNKDKNRESHEAPPSTDQTKSGISDYYIGLKFYVAG